MEKKYLCLLIGALLLFAGCGGDDQNRENSPVKKTEARTSGEHAADSGLKEPCELITRAEAGRLIGVDVNDGQYGEQKVVGLKKCFYEAAGSDKFLQVTVQQPAFMPQQTLEAGQSPRVIFAETKKMLADGRNDLSGMGDEAFIGTGGLHMLTGDYYITIGVGNPDQEGNRQVLEAAGRLILDKLQR